jgi:hypothetical protein
MAYVIQAPAGEQEFEDWVDFCAALKHLLDERDFGVTVFVRHEGEETPDRPAWGPQFTHEHPRPVKRWTRWF